MKKTWNDETCYIALNFSAGNTLEYRLDVPGLAVAGILDAVEEKASATIDASGASLTLPAFAAVFLTVQ